MLVLKKSDLLEASGARWPDWTYWGATPPSRRRRTPSAGSIGHLQSHSSFSISVAHARVTPGRGLIPIRHPAVYLLTVVTRLQVPATPA